MARYSKRRSRRGSKRKRRGGNLTNLLDRAKHAVAQGAAGAHDAVVRGAAGAHNLVESVSGETKKTAAAASALKSFI